MTVLLACPLCHQILDRAPKTWACPGGHRFDVAREGYVNLLPVQQKRSLSPGDRADMVLARRKFLEAGHYADLRAAAVDLLLPLAAASLLDIGCGEGYYTSAFCKAAPEVIGVDIAKPAIQLAARRFRTITWLVASSAHLPVQGGTLEVVTSLFAPLQVDEMIRVLKPGGWILVVTPGADHLRSVRARLFDEVRAHVPEKFLAEFPESCVLQDSRRVKRPLVLRGEELSQLLLMTPYAWRARPERRIDLESVDEFETETDFSLMLLQRR